MANLLRCYRHSGLVMYFSTLPVPSASAPCILAILTHLRVRVKICILTHPPDDCAILSLRRQQYKSLSEGRNRFRKALFCYGMPCRCLPRRHGTFATPARHVCHAGMARLPCRRGRCYCGISSRFLALPKQFPALPGRDAARGFRAQR